MQNDGVARKTKGWHAKRRVARKTKGGTQNDGGGKLGGEKKHDSIKMANFVAEINLNLNIDMNFSKIMASLVVLSATAACNNSTTDDEAPIIEKPEVTVEDGKLTP